MNTSHIKKYAIQARTDFIAAITSRAAQLAITADGIEPAQITGAGVVVGSITHPASIAEGRQRVVEAIEAQGFQPVIEQVAYTWFNRLIALRFMELHGYLDHGLRVLSNPGDAAVPEVVERLRDLDMPTLDKAKAIEMAMSGQQDEVLYRLILLAQCKQLAPAMPWLFDTRLHDGVDLLLPEGLLATDSILAKLVDGIPEEEWTTVDDDGNDRSVEIIGWLYQFFISERKDEVIGKVVAPEDIPAATQLFTPNWIVQYLVQNSLGRLWLESHPESGLKAHMPYYIEPTEQEPEVQAQLDAIWDRPIIPCAAQSFHDTRDVRSLRVLDPACGSGHILLEAFRLLFQIYLEQGHRKRDIPRLIFEHNLVGLDIDDRAAQLAGMSLLFEARQHDRRVLSDPPQLQVFAFQNGTEADIAAIDGSTFSMKDEAKALVNFFSDAKTFGSLLRFPFDLAAKLPDLRTAAEQALAAGDLFLGKAGELLLPLIAQAEVIAVTYDAVVANPPYMGGKGMTKDLKDFAKNDYPRSKADAFAMFIERGFELAKEHGFNSMVTMQSWMFLSSYEAMREDLLTKHTVHCLAHFPYDGKSPTAMGINFGVSVKCLRNAPMGNYKGHYCCSRWHELNSDGTPKEFPTPNERLKSTKQSDFAKIPGMPVAYWVSDHVRNTFERGTPLSDVAKPRVGMRTGDNERFLRLWHEVSWGSTAVSCDSASAAAHLGAKWVPFVKGGDFRKWYGNVEYVVNWHDNGREIKETTLQKYPQLSWDNLGWKISNESFYFRPAITWTAVSSAYFGVRYIDGGCIFGTGGSCVFPDEADSPLIGAILCSKVGRYLMDIGNPTLNINIEDVAVVPLMNVEDKSIEGMVENCREISRRDWNSFERSWAFSRSPMIPVDRCNPGDLRDSYLKMSSTCEMETLSMKQLEASINGTLIDAYELSEELDAEPDLEEITITANSVYRYGLDPEKATCRHRHDSTVELIAYSIGCMMGRYSLDHEGLIYAHAGNIDFDPSKYPTFPADNDGIVPLTDEPWFDDDATVRFEEFVSKAWPAEGLEDNLQFVADALGPKKNETSRDTIRRYFSKDFYKDHCTTYKKRPIYWLFSSGKRQAFQCLVYLHRYNADTLGRIRTEYVTPLHGKMRARLANLEDERDQASSTTATKQAQKAIDTLTKKLDELATFDDQLRHNADQRIDLDLDDGVKVNIQKFGGKNSLIDLKPLGNL